MSITRSKFWSIILIPIGGFLLWGILGNVLDHFLDKIGLFEKVKSLNPQNGIRQFMSLNVPVWKLILVFLVLGFPTYFLLLNRIVWKEKKTKQEKVYELFDKFKDEYRYVKLEGNESVEFRTYLSFNSENLVLNKIEPYCIEHAERIKMYLTDEDLPIYSCPKHQCKNSIMDDNFVYNSFTTLIISDLENKWERLIQTLK